MMIHKIEPHKYYPEFRNQEPKTTDYLLLFDGEKVYLPGKNISSSDAAQLSLPTFEEVHRLLSVRQPMDRFSWTANISFPSMTGLSIARPQKMPVL